ncbi:hypothetical protein B9G69_006415 [Bdellovibrio sp. SKB1291214]|uniref:hypothetical protein n=1 Tax=Bdellovibrio sp. SKB1291214 TaxID=1732569 RepID=UPI000B51B08D|nr:hypothetical protein [Bdellovibrio sp. SKB1291214]UYL10211.1 hypothetical protein B9G69_006415 [Bdellovibrio sp. SKB1291214]
MKNSMFLNTCGIAVLALCMTLNVACSESKQSSAGNPSPMAGSQMDGTTDGNGGNGVNGKMYESYIVNPLDLPAYKNILAQKFEALTNLEKDPQKAEITKKWLNLLFESKTWFLAPVSLKSLSKKTLGVEFIEGSTEQLALQTENEVWIDAKAFAQMSEIEQATLITHEFLMTSYLFNMKSEKEKCLKYQTIAEFQASLCNTLDSTEKKVELATKDYNRIRKATSLVMNMSANPTANDLKGFNNIFDDDSSDYQLSKDKEQEIPAEKIIAFLKKAKWAKSLNGTCRGIKTNTHAKCSFDVNFLENNTVQIVVTNEDTKEVLRNFQARVSKTVANVMEKHNGQNKILAIYGVATQSYLVEEGATQDSLDLIVNAEGTEVIGANIRRKIIASTSHQDGCFMISEAKMSAKTLIEDDIRIAISEEILTMKDKVTFQTSDFKTCVNADGSSYSAMQ